MSLLQNRHSLKPLPYGMSLLQNRHRPLALWNVFVCGMYLSMHILGDPQSVQLWNATAAALCYGYNKVKEKSFGEGYVSVLGGWRGGGHV